MGCQKINSTDIEEKIKPVYQTTMIRKKNRLKFSSKVCAEQKRSGLKFMLHADTNLKKIYKEKTSSSYMYVSSIDHGATRLGVTVYVKEGGSPFSQVLFINEH